MIKMQKFYLVKILFFIHRSIPGAQSADKVGSSTTSGTSSPVVEVNTQNEVLQQHSVTTQGSTQKRQYNKQNSTLKKQQKLLVQQHQQLLQQQFHQQISQSSSFDTVSQLASLFTNQQQNLLLAALQIQQQNQLTSPLPNNPFQQQQSQNPFSSLYPSMQQQQQQQQPSAQQQPQIKRKNSTQNTQLDYLIKPHKKVDRRHADPSVSFGLLLENILNELRELPEGNLNICQYYYFLFIVFIIYCIDFFILSSTVFVSC